MRVTIDITDTATGSAPVEIRLPEPAVVTSTTPAAVMGGGMSGETLGYDGGADLGAPLSPEPSAQAGAATSAPTASGVAQDGGAAPGATERAFNGRIPTQIEDRLS